MKKLLLILLLLVSTLSLGATTLKVGASPVPHAEILNFVKEDLKNEGVNLEIIEITDYVTPNLMLSDKELDANFFQHTPYLETFSKEKGLKLTSLSGIHVEPLALYSKKYKTLNDVPEKSIIAIPNDPTNGGRALILLHNNGIITLNDPKNLLATEADIKNNPKKLKFKALDAAQLPRILPDVAAAVINGNYALEAGLKPSKDSLLVEGKESPYANIVAVRTEDIKREDLLKLQKALTSEKVRKFITEKYNGGVVPAF
ncbi:MAG: MetQ/NlpA family ABC transporter substrate-binding protein [Fusobacteriaceae bacterium]|nr:MetQ/NlpA family ABC transporter substrate-binding protein [Fusobacteriaceae bacterium]